MPDYSSSFSLKSGLEAQLSLLFALTRKTHYSMRQLSALNLQFMQQIMHDSAEASRQLASCRDPFQFAATAAVAAQPVILHLHRYQQQLVGVLTGAQGASLGAKGDLPHVVDDASVMAYRLTHEVASSERANAARLESAGESTAGSTPHSLH